MVLAGNVARSGRLPNKSVKRTVNPLRGSPAAYFQRWATKHTNSQGQERWDEHQSEDR